MNPGGWLNDSENMRALREELAKQPSPPAHFVTGLSVVRSKGMRSKLLDLITPKRIEGLGLLVMAIGAARQHNVAVRVLAAVCVLVYVALRVVPRASKPFEPLESFAKVPNWPEYVAIQLSSAVVAIHGGWMAGVFIVGVAIVGAGRLYSALYP